MLLIALLLAPAGAWAQSAFTSSSFGEIRTPAPPRTLALGGLSAVTPWGDIPTAVGMRNPALAAFSTSTLFGVSWELGHISGDYPDGTASLWETGPRLMGVLLPFGKGWAGSVQLAPITVFDFEVHTPDTQVGGVPVRYDYTGTGGLNLGQVGLAWKSADDRIAAGVSGNIIFGALKQAWRVEYGPSGYVDTNDRLQRQNRGHGWSAGLQVQPIDRLRLGLVWESGGRLNTKQVYLTTAAGSDTSRGVMDLGGTIMASAGFQIDRQWAVYADYRRTAWDRSAWVSAPVTPSGSGIGTPDLSILRADSDMGFGIERRSLPDVDQRTWLDALPVRAGLRWGSMYAPDLDSGQVDQWFATLGSSFRLGKSDGGWLDVSLQYGGRTGSTGIREGFWRLQFGFSGAEEWFKPPQR
jgi:hypothetical protein